MTGPPPSDQPAPPVARWSWAQNTTGDSPAAVDSLGFEPYARALAEFLLNRETQGPLTVSVEGEWGSGKSTFLQLLENCLAAESQAKTAKGVPHNIPLIARFNPWRHDRDEALWAAFAVGLTREIVRNQHLRSRLLGHWKLFTSRFQWRHGWIELLKAVVIFLVATGLLVSAVVLAAHHGPDWMLQLAGHAREDKGLEWLKWFSGFGFFGACFAYLIALIVAASKLKTLLAVPIGVNLSKYLRTPDYASKVSFVEQFHQDLRRVVEAYAGDRTIFAFIDDLDRCSVPRAAELMQAINLMISTDLKRIVFILGMDREKIAAGLAVRNAELLPYLYPDVAATADAKSFPPRAGLQFGFEYIEKFIQLVFQLPKPRAIDVDRFLRSLTAAEAPSPNSQSARDGTGEPSAAAQPAPGGPSAEPATASIQFQTEFSTDSENMREIVRAISPFLGDNPRRLKQFINVFRLRAFIAYETGLLRPGRMTPQQLGKLVGLQMRWPLKMAAYSRRSESLRQLQANPSDPDAEFMALLDLTGGPDGNIWSLKQADLEGFFRISPVVRTIAAPAPSAQAAPPSRAEPPADAGPPAKILWVDNQPDNNASLQEYLSGEFELAFTQCGTTEQALHLARTETYALIISDLGRPGDHHAGLTLLIELRKAGNQVPYLIYTSRADERVRSEAQKLGALDVTDQPQSIVSVVAGIARPRISRAAKAV